MHEFLLVYVAEISFHLEKKVAERRYSALLQHNTYASIIYPTHQVRVRSVMEMQADLEVPFQRVLHQTELYHSVEMRLYCRIRVVKSKCAVLKTVDIKIMINGF